MEKAHTMSVISIKSKYILRFSIDFETYNSPIFSLIRLNIGENFYNTLSKSSKRYVWRLNIHKEDVISNIIII